MFRGTPRGSSDANGIGRSRVLMPAPMLRYARLLALAILAFVCVGCTKPVPRSTNYAGPVEAVITTAGTALRATTANTTVHRWRDRVAPTVDHEEVVTLDDDDVDGEREGQLRAAHHSTSGWGGARHGSESGSASRSELPRDPSCFASGTGLPRGPPAIRA